MPDMLVALYRLPSAAPHIGALADAGIRIRAALAPEKHLVERFVKDHFSAAWESEVAVCFGKTPVTCLLALKGKRIVGFSCYDAIKNNFFGPTGVHEDYRKQGIGVALLILTLETQKTLGYAYSVIGGAGPVEFYKKSVNAIVIPDSEPGIYEDMLI